MINYTYEGHKRPYSGNLGNYKSGRKYEVIDAIKETYRQTRALELMQCRVESLSSLYVKSHDDDLEISINQMLQTMGHMQEEIYRQKIIISKIINDISDPLQKAVLQLKLVDRLPMGDICRRVHYAPTSVYNAYHKGLAALDELYKATREKE